MAKYQAVYHSSTSPVTVITTPIGGSNRTALDRHVRMDMVVSPVLIDSCMGGRIRSVVITNDVWTPSNDAAPPTSAAMHVVTRTEYGKRYLESVPAPYYDIEVDVDALLDSDKVPATYLMRSLAYYDGNTRKNIPLDLRPFLELRVPAVAIIPASCLYAGCSDIDLVDHPHADAERTAIPLEYFQDHPSSVILPEQPLYERVLSLLNSRSIRSHLNRTMIAAYYDSDGNPIPPAIASYWSSSLYNLPPLAPVLDPNLHTLIAGSLLLKRATMLNIGAPCITFYNESSLRRSTYVPNSTVATLVLNAAIYRYGEDSVPEMVLLIDEHMKKGGRVGGVAAVMDRASILLGRHMRHHRQVQMSPDVIFNSGVFLWSSPLIIDNISRSAHGRYGLTSLMHVITGSRLPRIMEAKRSLKLVKSGGY